MLSLANSWLLLSALPLLVRADISYQPCPLLGPRLPMPTALATSETMHAALGNLTKTFDEIVSTGNSSYGQVSPNTTSFSVALFSTHDLGNASEPFIYQYHYTALSLAVDIYGNRKVDSNTIYNIGGLTQMLTVYAFLICAGDYHWQQPITKYLPELASSSHLQHLESIQWEDVQLKDLASHMAGIPRDANLDQLLNLQLHSNIFSLLPTPISNYTDRRVHSPRTREGFFRDLSARGPVYLPATTPIYSNLGFQLLAFALEKITGRPFHDMINESMFNVLKMKSTTLGTPSSTNARVIPVNETISGWAEALVGDSALLAADSIFSTITDLSKAGNAIMASSLLSPAQTRRWLKPVSHTSNLVNDVGMPFDIYKATFDFTSTGAVIPIYTKLGPNGLYSPYFGLVPDYNVGFVILSVDTESAADLNVHADVIAQFLLPALETTTMEQAARNFGGSYTDLTDDTESIMTIEIDGSSGLSVTNWTIAGKDIRAAYAQLNGINPATMDFRLYPTNRQAKTPTRSQMAFRAVFQDREAPVDAGTPTCVTWMVGVDSLVHNGLALDEFVFALDADGSAMEVEVPTLGMKLAREAGGE